MKLDLRPLRHLLAVDRYRNFARAAETIGLTQPALSRSIQALEESIGARLFDRDRSGVEPTPVGLRLIGHARQLLDQALDVERDLQLMLDGEVGLLRVGVGPFPAEISVGTAMGRLLRKHPALTVDITVADWPELTRQVLSGHVDLIVAEMSMAEDDDRLVVEPLPSHQGTFFCRAGHALAGRRDLTLDEVRRYPLVNTSVPPRLLKLAASGGNAAHTSLREGVANTEIRVGDYSLVRQIVMESDTVGVAPPRMIERELADGSLVTLLLDLPWVRTGYGIIHLAQRTLSPTAVAFLVELRAVEQEIVAGGAGSGP